MHGAALVELAVAGAAVPRHRESSRQLAHRLPSMGIKVIFWSITIGVQNRGAGDVGKYGDISLSVGVPVATQASVSPNHRSALASLKPPPESSLGGITCNAGFAPCGGDLRFALQPKLPSNQACMLLHKPGCNCGHVQD